MLNKFIYNKTHSDLLGDGDEEQRRTNFINSVTSFVLFGVTMLFWVLPEISVTVYMFWGVAWLLTGFFCIVSMLAGIVWLISLYQHYVKQNPIDFMPYKPQENGKYFSSIAIFFVAFTLWQFDYSVTLNWFVGAYILLQICGFAIRITWRKVTLSPITP